VLYKGADDNSTSPSIKTVESMTVRPKIQAITIANFPPINFKNVGANTDDKIIDPYKHESDVTPSPAS
jgi:hypothetical protein